MRKIPLFVALSTIVMIVPAAAMPMAPLHADVDGQAQAMIEVKGGHGHGHGWGRGHGHGAFAWGRGRGGKVGWRGHHCPPGHWKKGWC